MDINSEAGTTDTHHPNGCKIYFGQQLPTEASWSSGDILYQLNWIDAIRPEQGQIVGTCLSKEPFVLDTLPQTISKPRYYGGSDGLPMPAFEVITKMLATPKSNTTNFPQVLNDLKISSLLSNHLRIWSTFVLDTLHARTTFGLQKKHERDMGPGLTIDEPYHLLLHYVPEMHKIVQESKHSDVEHFKLLLDFLRPFVMTHCDPAQRLVANKVAEDALVDYNSLWYHFAPGREVYVRGNDGGRASGAVMKCHRYGDGKFILELWTIVIGASGLQMQTRLHKTLEFGGCRRIIDLPCCPAEFWDAHDGGKTRAACLRSSRAILELRSLGHPGKHYCGPVNWYRKSEPEGSVVKGYVGHAGNPCSGIH